MGYITFIIGLEIYVVLLHIIENVYINKLS